jgi:hypothetical protein
MTFPYWSLNWISRREPKFDFSRATATIAVSVEVKWEGNATGPESRSVSTVRRTRLHFVHGDEWICFGM